MSHLQELVKEGVFHRFAKKSGVTFADKVVKDVDHRLAVDCRHLFENITIFLYDDPVKIWPKSSFRTLTPANTLDKGEPGPGAKKHHSVGIDG